MRLGATNSATWSAATANVRSPSLSNTQECESFWSVQFMAPAQFVFPRRKWPAFQRLPSEGGSPRGPAKKTLLGLEILQDLSPAECSAPELSIPDTICVLRGETQPATPAAASLWSSFRFHPIARPRASYATEKSAPPAMASGRNVPRHLLRRCSALHGAAREGLCGCLVR